MSRGGLHANLDFVPSDTFVRRLGNIIFVLSTYCTHPSSDEH